MLALRRVKNIGRAEAFETAKSVLAKVANRVIYMNTGRVWETGSGDMLVRPETQELKEFLANGL
eukprot:gene5470-6815_t